MDRFGPEDRRERGSAARSTSCRPARRCARTTTSPTRSGCIVLEGELTRPPSRRRGRAQARATSAASRSARRARTRSSTRRRDRPADDALDQGRAGVLRLSRLEQDRLWTAPRAARAWSRLGENLDYYDGETPLEEGLALAAVGRHGVDELAAARPGARRRSARTARPPWRGGTTRGRRPAARRPPCPAAASAPRRRPRGRPASGPRAGTGAAAGRAPRRRDAG